jgi:hypothetical protein
MFCDSNILKPNEYYYYNCSVVNVIFEAANPKIRIRDIKLGSEFTVAIHKILRIKFGIEESEKKHPANMQSDS